MTKITLHKLYPQTQQTKNTILSLFSLMSLQFLNKNFLKLKKISKTKILHNQS